MEVNGRSRIGLTFWIIFVLFNSFLQNGDGTDDHRNVPSCPAVCLCKSGSFVEVVCTGKNLSSVPLDLPEDMMLLDLSLNNISYIPDFTFVKYTRLKELRLASNRISNLSDNSFAGLGYLTNLLLQDNQLGNMSTLAFKRLYSLHKLNLDANNISTIPVGCFSGMKNLMQLRLDFNKLSEIPVEALSQLELLQYLDLSVNRIKCIPDYAFGNLSNLQILSMRDNRITEIGDYAFEGLRLLTQLGLNRNRLRHIPAAFISLSEVKEIWLEDNAIEFIPDHSFEGNKKLETLILHGNPIRSYEKNAFKSLPELRKLKISEARDTTEFPNLRGTGTLTELRLDRSGIGQIPDDICQTNPFLTILDLHSNRITVIPRLGNCTSLTQLNLANNQIQSLGEGVLINVTTLKDLTLSRNDIAKIPNDAFSGLVELEYLDISNNKIEEIEDKAFVNLKNLNDLNLSENRFPRLPTDGLQNLRHLKTFHNKNLQEPITPDEFPNVETLTLSYAYHCCNFKNTGTKPNNDVTEVDDRIIWLGGESDIFRQNNINNTNADFLYYDDDIKSFEDLMDKDRSLPKEYPAIHIRQNDYVHMRGPVQCTPVPGPFLPCDDLFGWWSLRCGVWIVFLLAVAGNGIVLFVSISGRSKMDVPRFLICNLACADFCMGVYLGMLAIVDASTLGEFQQYAIRWQISPGCMVAGYLGVFSSELSVFTLTVITLERYYAISHALQYSKRLTLKHAGFIMIGGWLFCILISSLPLFNISDYRKFAICLPFETSETKSLAYVCFIMLFNTISFAVIVCCYIKIYVSILGSQAWNTKDFRVAKRMAVLVFTDFLCWSPIILFSITAAFGSELIGLNEAKVLTIFVLPLNSCANPFLYAIFTKQFKRDCVKLCKRIEESSISRSLSSLNSRRVSLGCGSSWRHSQLHSPFHTEKRSSCSNSLSGTSSNPGGIVHTNEGSNTYEQGRSYRKQSGDSLLEPSSISGDERVPLPTRRKSRQMSGQNCTSFTECDNQDGKDRTRKLSVGLAGSESQIVIHFDEKGNIKKPTEDTNERKVHSRLSKRTLSPASPIPDEYGPSTALVEQSSPATSKGQSDSTSDNVQIVENNQKKSHDLSAKELFMKYRRNKQLQARKEQRKEKRFSNVDKLLHGSSAPDVPQADKNVILRLPDKTNEPDKTSHINEWRKSSHLSFLWRNSLDMEGNMPTYKSNSLVELNRSSRDFHTMPCKRRSLSSRHEGYILLKSNNRDSAYEDEDEMLEFKESTEFTVSPYTQKGQVAYYTSSDSNTNCDKRQNDGDLKEANMEEKLSFVDSFHNSQTSKRGSCDKESGFSSENLVS